MPDHPQPPPDKLEVIVGLLKEILAGENKLIAALFDVAAFKVTTSEPVKQAGKENAAMAGNIKSLGNSTSQAMLDDQTDVMSIAPVNSQGVATALPTGSPVPTYAASPGTAVTLNPSTDPTGLSCTVSGIPGQQGTETVTATFTNADGTVATGTAIYTMTIDPAELDVAGFDVTTSTPVAQTPASAKKRP